MILRKDDTLNETSRVEESKALDTLFPPKNRLNLLLLPGRLAVCRLSATADAPDWFRGGALHSITRTPDELSVVCDEAHVPASVNAQRGFRAVRVEGALDFALTGVLSSLAAPLAQAKVSIFALSTYDTDYLLVREADLDRARDAWIAAGHAAAW